MKAPRKITSMDKAAMIQYLKTVAQHLENDDTILSMTSVNHSNNLKQKTSTVTVKLRVNEPLPPELYQIFGSEK